MATLLQKLAKRGGDYIDVKTKVDMTVTATANTDFILTLPTGAMGINYTVFTTTAFTASTDITIQIGTTSGGSDLVAATTIKALGVYALTRAAATAAQHLSPPTTIFVRLIQTGTPTAVGAAGLTMLYGMPVS